MTLKISKIRYTSRNGFTVDFERPGAVRLTTEQAYVLYLSLDSGLTQAEMERRFTEAEQQTIIQYHELTLEKMLNPDEALIQRAKTSGLQTSLAKVIDHWLMVAPRDIQTKVEKILGWRFPSNYVSCNDKLFEDLDWD